MQIGAGYRGVKAYTPYVNNYPNELEFVVVEESVPERRVTFAEEYSLSDDQCTMEMTLDHPRRSVPKLRDFKTGK